MAEFTLLDVAFLENGKMDENGRRQLTKRFLYRLNGNSGADRKLALLQLGDMPPKLGSGMLEDSRYVCKSATWNCLNAQNQAREYYIDVLYERVSDDERASAPWNLKPFNCERSTVSLRRAFSLAYNAQNKKKIRVVNSAGDPFEAETDESIRQFSFSFYAENYDDIDEFEYGNSVNKDFQRILGIKCAAKTLLLLPFTITKQITYENDGVTVKWEYYQIDMVMRYREDGWERQILDVGNRAIFNGEYAEDIYQYKKVSATGAPDSSEFVFTNWNDYKQANDLYQKSNTGVLAHEFAESVPLTAEGKIDLEILKAQKNPKKKDEEIKPYPVKRFQEYKVLSWKALDLPEEIENKDW